MGKEQLLTNTIPIQKEVKAMVSVNFTSRLQGSTHEDYHSWVLGWEQLSHWERLDLGQRTWCWPSFYWYQGVFLTQWRVKPASVRILMEAASASLTVSFTDCIRFWALCTNISVAWERERGACLNPRLQLAVHLYCTSHQPIVVNVYLILF